MQGKLQQIYRVNHEIGRHGDFEGLIELSALKRLSSLILADEESASPSVIQVRFEFNLNTLKKAVIKGHIATTLAVECQRCLDPMSHKVDQDFELLIDASDEEVQQFQLDTAYSDEGFLDVFEVIEDELILSLPLILMHEDSSCNTFWVPETVDEVDSGKPNPFAVLSTLKEK